MRITRTTGFFEGSLAVLFLLAYMVSTLSGYVHTGSGHHLHGDAEHTCSESAHAEVDSCHLAIFHGSHAQCGHESHMHETADDCQLCNLLLTKIEIEEGVSYFDVFTLIFEPLQYPYVSKDFSSWDEYAANPRGPPAQLA